MKFDILKRIVGAITFVSLLATTADAADVTLPSFLPSYYGAVLRSKGSPLVLRTQIETNGVTQFLYSIGRDEMLSVENIAGDAPACRSVFNNILGHLNQLITTNKGSFVQVSETEVQAGIVLTNMSQNFFAFVMPHGVTMWTHSTATGVADQFQSGFEDVLSMANRQRYEDALKEGNVAMGQWQKSIHEHARRMLKAGRKTEALMVLKNLLMTAPFDFQAHLEFIESSPDQVAATNSAKVVFKSAEDLGEINKAATFLGAEIRTLEKIAPLSTNDTGFEVVLIPIAPCNPWLLDEVAETYQRITDVPVKIRRLPQEWSWKTPERIGRQREIESFLARFAKTNIVFTGWDRARYFRALTDAVKTEDAFSKYWVNDLMAKAKAEPGQYRAEGYVTALCEMLQTNRSKDTRTMYVGITEANIYGGDNNYVFSVASMDPKSHAGLMSYHMMLGKTIPQGFDSRQRLIERIAKELVPASLKQLEIPRSTDPTCPYSYSNGLDRLDQKTLKLSDEVKQALTKLKAGSLP